MSTDAGHVQASAAMDEFKKFNSILEDQIQRTVNGNFTATDETGTVNVIINGDQALTGLWIEDGLLRLGAQTVEQRINEALLKAQAEAMGKLEAEQELLVGAITEMASNLLDILKQV